MIDDESFKDLPFEEKIKIMEGMSERQLQENLEQVKYMCKDFCGKCPSYQGTGETDFAFCSIGKSSRIKENNGCLCKQCPISKMMSLRWEIYCTEGSALELAIAEKK
ncbi:MAG: DUF2769 domain-containing protein [Candidatus Heimdallarchaeota archaeon]